MANFELKEDYMRMTSSAAYSFESYKAAIHEGVALCEQHQLTKLPADARTLDINIPVLDRFKLGVDMTDILENTIIFAILWFPQKLLTRWEKMRQSTEAERTGGYVSQPFCGAGPEMAGREMKPC